MVNYIAETFKAKTDSEKMSDTTVLANCGNLLYLKYVPCGFTQGWGRCLEVSTLTILVLRIRRYCLNLIHCTHFALAVNASPDLQMTLKPIFWTLNLCTAQIRSILEA